MKKKILIGLMIVAVIAIAFVYLSTPKVEWTATDYSDNVYKFESWTPPLNNYSACVIAVNAAKNLPGGAKDFECYTVKGPDVPGSAPWIVESKPSPVSPTEFMPNNTAIINVEINERTLNITVRQFIKGEVIDFMPVNTCEVLSQNFDAKINSIVAAECDKWLSEENPPPIWVGGTLINITKNAWEDGNDFTLTFQGATKQGTITIGTRNESVPYQTGQFYKFNLERKCDLIYSMHSSGMFPDPDLNALEHIEECD